MAYYSRLNIQLGVIPTLPEDFGELQTTFQELYNAVHMLNSAMDATVGIISQPKPDAPPTQSMTFQMRSFFAPVAESVDGARMVVYLPRDATEYRPGATGYITASSGGRKVTGPWAMTLGERDENTGEALLGIPPAIVAMEEATTVGQYVSTKNDGELYINKDGSDYWIVGQVIKEGYVLLQPGHYL